MGSPRSLAEIRAVIGAMPFVQSMRLAVDEAGELGVVSMPLHRDVTFDGEAFAGVAVATVADVAAGVAALAQLDRAQMPLTVRVDSSIIASTRGSRLRATARLREQGGSVLVYDAMVEVERSEAWAECGAAAVTLRIR